jgi:iron complex outermembrane receptor protein
VPPPPATLPAPARDATVPAPAEPPADAPQRIEITADTQSDTEQRRRDPVARTIVGRDELDRFNDPSVLDVLKRQPGVNLSGGNPRLRGLGAGYTLILVNGERAPPGFSLENLPPSQVERIEITKGPTAEHSAQAVAGTINIILRSAPRQRQRELAFRAGYTRGKPVFGANATWADRVGPFTVSVPVSGYTWSSGQTVRGERLSRDTALLLQRVAYEGDERWWGGGATVGPRVNWRVSDATTLEWSAFLQRNEFRNANDFVNRVVAGSTPRSLLDTSVSGGFWKTARTGLSLQQRWPGGARLEARAGLQATRNAWSGHFEGRDTAGQLAVVRDNTGRNDEDSGSTSGKFTWPWGEAHTLAAGWDIDRRDRTEVRSVVENGVSQLIGFDARPFEAQIDRSAVYVQDEWQLSPRWGAYLGLRAERIVTTSRDDGDVRRSASQVVTPILHLQHRFDAKGRDLLRIGLTRSYRAPDIGALMARPSINSNFPASGPNNEQYPDRNGNPQLKPELSWGLDIALEQYLPRGGVISAGLFHRRVQGLIRNVVSEQAVSWSPVPRWVSVPVNLPGARSTGLELEVKGRADDLLPALPLPGAMNLRASLSVYRSQVDDIPGPDNRLEAQQPWQLGLGLDHRVAGTPLGFGVGFQFTPGYRTQLNTQQSRQVNRVRNLDGYLSWQFSPAVTVRLSGNNLPHVQNGARHETVETAGTTLFDDARRRQRHTVFLGVSARL